MISYSLSGRKNALEITRKIYGFTDSSNHGKYTYERKGILSEISYEKIARTVIWVDPKDADFVIENLQKLGLKLKVVDLIIKR